jgi:hypothetical protein
MKMIQDSSNFLGSKRESSKGPQGIDVMRNMKACVSASICGKDLDLP